MIIQYTSDNILTQEALLCKESHTVCSSNVISEIWPDCFLSRLVKISPKRHVHNMYMRCGHASMRRFEGAYTRISC